MRWKVLIGWGVVAALVALTLSGRMITDEVKKLPTSGKTEKQDTKTGSSGLLA